jgi:hypothetical protein
MAKLTDIEGIGDVNAEKLKAAGVGSTNALLKQGGTAKGRKAIEAATSLSHSALLRWVNHADLFRITGVAGEYAELLEAAGVDSVPELKRRNPANLVAKMAEVNAQKKLVRNVPAESQVSRWVDQARSLPKAVSH